LIAGILGIVACLTVLGMCIAADNGITVDVAYALAVDMALACLACYGVMVTAIGHWVVVWLAQNGA